MKVKFSISFPTIWGQKLAVLGSIPELGKWKRTEARGMDYVSDNIWQLEIEISSIPDRLHYRYILIEGEHIILEEWDKGHEIALEPTAFSYSFEDCWQATPANLPYYSTAFTKGINVHIACSGSAFVDSDQLLILKVWAPRIERHQAVSLAGNQSFLGYWEVDKSLKMNCVAPAEWEIVLDAREIRYPFEFKFFVCDVETSELIYWEVGDNRVLTDRTTRGEGITVVSGLFIKDNLPGGHYVGTAIPLFSLRSENSWGVGDFGDLKQFVDWIKLTGQQVIQLLPINDTTATHTWKDSYPYSAISIYALHPIYVDLSSLGMLDHIEDQSFYEKNRKRLNASPTLEYEAVLKLKTTYMRALFKQQGKEVLSSDDFDAFYLQNQSWLVPYAAYCYLRDSLGTTDFSQWGEYETYNKVCVHAICDELSDSYPEIAFVYFYQFILHKQFLSVTDYARANGIVLKGDLPIGIDRRSVDAWTDPGLFNTQCQAGAPPDDFSVNGQNWKFPTYKWEVMEKDRYAWWKKRFKGMSLYFDCFRIDHILGFFRIWEIPNEYIQGLCGHFNPALPLSRKEIEQYGFVLNESIHTIAHINEAYLSELFGSLSGEVSDTYLDRITSQFYVLKVFCNTQQKIEEIFKDRKDERSLHIKKGLFTIANEVLFLKDPYEKEKFHPRISASHSYVYKDLFSDDQYAFDQLYWDFFYYRHNDFWKAEAYKRLTPLVSGTEMLVCGEDLGMIPDTVHEVMSRLQILSLELERMPKNIGSEFANLKNLPYLSVCTTSTHDMPPLRAWWSEDPERTQRYYAQVLQGEGRAPVDCTPEIALKILRNHLSSPSIFAIFPWQDWLAMDRDLRNPEVQSERINVPADPDHYWCYRMHLTIEQLLSSEDLNKKIRTLIADSGRTN